MTKPFIRPLKIFYNGKGLKTFSVFYDGSDDPSPYYEFVTDATEAEVVYMNVLHMSDIKPDVCSLKNEFANLKLVIIVTVFHVAEYQTALHNQQIQKQMDEINSDPNLPYVMMLTMDNNYSRQKQTHRTSIQYTDYIFNTMVMLYKDQPKRIFDEFHDGIHWWHHYNDNDTPGLRRENYILHDLRDLPPWKTIEWQAGVGGVPKLYVSPSRCRFTEKFNRHLSAYKDWNPYDEPPEAYTGLEYRDCLRNEMQALLSNYPGFLGDGSKNTSLVGEGVTPLQLASGISNMNMPGNVPINNEYYRHSALTINIETLTIDNFEAQTPRCVTEKTFETILKGHTPLTFAYKGFYRDLQDIYNIRLPNWIDYDKFDSEPDNLIRWIRFKLEVTRVLNLGAKKLFTFRTLQVDNLEHNRSMILDKGLKDPVHAAISDFLYYCKSLPEKPAGLKFISEIIG